MDTLVWLNADMHLLPRHSAMEMAECTQVATTLRAFYQEQVEELQCDGVAGS